MKLVFGSEEANEILENEKLSPFSVRYTEQELIDLFSGVEAVIKNKFGESATFGSGLGDYSVRECDHMFSYVVAIANIIQQLPELLAGIEIPDKRNY